ncbi:MAG: hypothetical protein H7267_13455, partial [Sandarakinorhabdus sp.]|nr:hypothetical protein [Sandarakinorhabdus sp.]
MIPVITDSLIAAATQTQKMLQSGQNYWAQGHVTALHVDDAAGVITANVKGSGRNAYIVMVIFHEGTAGQFLAEVDCECPVGFGCKHGAAVLFALQCRGRQQLGQSALPLPRSTALVLPPAQPAPLPVPLLNWLSEAQTIAMRPLGTVSGCKIAYVFASRALQGRKQGKAAAGLPQAGLQPQLLVVTARLDEPAVNGQRRLTQVHGHSAHLASLTQDPIDSWLVRRMSQYGGDFDSAGSPTGIGGADWLHTAIATGRAHWAKADGPVLHEAPSLAARFDWAMQSDGSQRLVLDLADGTDADDLILLAQTPPLLVNGRTGAIHAIETGVDGIRARQLLILPPVPPHAVATVAARWGEIVGDAVAPPGLSRLVDRGVITPIPILTFREESLDVHFPSRGRYASYGTTKQTTALARLSFDYDGCILTPGTEATLIYAPGLNGMMRFQRDLSAEGHAFDRLFDTSLQPLDVFAAIKPKPAQDWDFTVNPSARPADFATILQQDVPRLRSEGWRIEYATKWSLNIVEIDADSLAFDVAPSGIDWFDISLGVRIDGKAYDILPLLRQLLAANGAALLDQPGGVMSLPLGPGKIAQVPLDKLKPVLASLLQLALHDGTAEGKLRLPTRDFATLADLESATQGHVPWSGAEPLRQLARALTRLQTEPTVLPASFKASLRPYQQQGLDWLQALYHAGFGGVLADDMGLGKTVQALAHLVTLKASGKLQGPALIVCPTSVLPNWQAEIAQFAPDLHSVLWHGSDRHALAPEIADADTLLTSYPLLARDAELASRNTG